MADLMDETLDLETIVWHRPAVVMPVQWLTVLAVVVDEGPESVVAAYAYRSYDDDDDGVQWNYDDGDSSKVYGRILKWAHMPTGGGPRSTPKK